ncbi:hypothetical protein KX816_13560 [Sphingosinicellaceae bacterium]|nr:hypothetical protein KX816_13560 [Sphingosinicellaceae bacterium]
MFNRLLRPLILAALLSASGLAQPSNSVQPSLVMPPIVVAAPGPGGSRLTDHGLVANWYPGTGARKHAAILLLGGSEGGLGPGTARQASDLAAHGYAVLQLAYFGVPGLPPQLDMVPLDYFDKALSWLRRQPSVKADRIGIMGASKGAEAALLIASHNPDVRAVIVGAPSAVAWQGIDFSGQKVQSSWSLNGRPLEHLSYGDGATTMLGAYEAGLNTLASHPGAAIPVAHIKARVMLVCGRSDALWPSCSMSEMVARAMGGRATVLAYSDAGHAVFGPPLLATSPGYASLGALGGTAAGNQAARADAWPKVLRFLTVNLGSVDEL